MCFRVDERAGRLSKIDGLSETVVLELDQSQQDELSDLGNPACLSQEFTTIASIDQADGQHLVVSMGPTGALHRGPDGVWHWVAVGSWKVPDDVGATYFGVLTSPPE